MATTTTQTTTIREMGIKHGVNRATLTDWVRANPTHCGRGREGGSPMSNPDQSPAIAAATRALPVRLGDGRYEPCPVEEATHVTLNIPGPVGILTLPVMLKGTREGTGNWTWNGSTTAPTLRPSVLNTGHAHRCHTWITDGQAQYLDDCSHDLRGQTVPLNEVP